MSISKDKNKLIDTQKIKTLCEESNISYAELGRKIGLQDRDLITRRLGNQYSITGDELFLIADEFGLSVDCLRIR